MWMGNKQQISHAEAQRQTFHQTRHSYQPLNSRFHQRADRERIINAESLCRAEKLVEEKNCPAKGRVARKRGIKMKLNELRNGNLYYWKWLVRIVSKRAMKPKPLFRWRCGEVFQARIFLPRFFGMRRKFKFDEIVKFKFGRKAIADEIGILLSGQVWWDCADNAALSIALTVT